MTSPDTPLKTVFYFSLYDVKDSGFLRWPSKVKCCANAPKAHTLQWKVDKTQEFFTVVRQKKMQVLCVLIN